MPKYDCSIYIPQGEGETWEELFHQKWIVGETPAHAAEEAVNYACNDADDYCIILREDGQRDVCNIVGTRKK